MIANKTYTVSDGEMVLTLEPAEEGGFVVTSPLDPELVTEAESLNEAFENARDAADALNPEFTGPYWEKLDRFFKVSPSLGKA